MIFILIFFVFIEFKVIILVIIGFNATFIVV